MKSLDESIQEIPLAKTCSLYRAACWIAFNERPIEESLAKVVYQKHYEVEVTEHEYEGSQWIETEIHWQDDTSESKFKESCKYVHSLLIRGEVKAFGNNADGDFFDKESISPDYFEPDYLNIDWLDSDAYKKEESLCINEVYYAVEIRVSDLQKALRQEDKNKAKTGRPPKYDWDGFFREIVRIANGLDGLPEQQAELEKIMAQWTINNWGEQPAESLIRDKISPLYLKAKK